MAVSMNCEYRHVNPGRLKWLEHMGQSIGEIRATKRKCFRDLNRATLEFLLNIKWHIYIYIYIYIYMVNFHKVRPRTTIIDYKAEQFLEFIVAVGAFAFQPATPKRTH